MRLLSPQYKICILFPLLACYFAFLLPAVCLSQNPDSLKNFLVFDKSGNIPKDTANVSYLLKVANAYNHTQSDSSIKYARTALALSEKMDYTKGILNANRVIGRIFFFRGDYQKLMEVANRSLQEIHQQPGYEKEKAKINQMLGIAHSTLGSYQPGLKYFMKARDLYKQANDKNGVFINTSNIGVNYIILEDYKKALNIFLELDTLKTVNHTNHLIPTNLGEIYFKMGNYQKAEEQLNRVLNYSQTENDRPALGESLLILGKIYRNQEKYKKAIVSFKQSIQTYDEMQNEIEKVPALNGLALTYLAQRKPTEALTYAKKAFKIAEDLKSLPEKNGSAETLYKIYANMNDADMALKYHVMHKTLSDSLLNAEISKEVGRLEAEHEFEQRERELKDLQKRQNLKNENRVAEQRIYLVIALSLLVISLLIAHQFYRNSYLRKKANKALKDKNREIISQAEELKELNEIKNHLFSIISHDLRGPLSSLSGFLELYELDALSKEDIETMMPIIADRFKHTSSLLNNLLSWSKSQLEGYQTNPEDFYVADVLENVTHLISHKAEAKNITLINSVDKHITAFADKNMVEMVLLNLLANAAKFTPENGTIEVIASEQDNATKISVKDTGVGIPQDKIDLLFQDNKFYTTEGTNDEKGTGLGLMLCKDFIKKNNGDLNVKSEPGKGSTFYFVLPASQISNSDLVPA